MFLYSYQVIYLNRFSLSTYFNNIIIRKSINCKNVTIKNLKIDYDRPFYTQADVLSVEKGKMEIKINDGFDYEIKDIQKADSYASRSNARI